MARTSQKELLEELQKSNQQMAEAMKAMQKQIEVLSANQKKPLLNIFHNTTKEVVQSAKTCDSTLEALLREKELLRTDVNKVLGNLKRASKDSDVIQAVQETYDSCDQDLDKAIKSIQSMKSTLEEETVSTAEIIRIKFNELKDDVSNGIKNVSNDIYNDIQNIIERLGNKASQICANVYEKAADGHRRNANKFKKINEAIVNFDKKVQEGKLRLKNAVHALKGESFEPFKYVPQGFVGKVYDFMQNREMYHTGTARDFQAKADTLKKFKSMNIPQLLQTEEGLDELIYLENERKAVGVSFEELTAFIEDENIPSFLTRLSAEQIARLEAMCDVMDSLDLTAEAFETAVASKAFRAAYNLSEVMHDITSSQPKESLEEDELLTISHPWQVEINQLPPDILLTVEYDSGFYEVISANKVMELNEEELSSISAIKINHASMEYSRNKDISSLIERANNKIEEEQQMRNALK